MAQTYETPPVKGGVRGDLLPSVSRTLSSLSDLRAQLLAQRLGISHHRAVLIAELHFGEVTA